jgi:hypothetical protein
MPPPPQPPTPDNYLFYSLSVYLLWPWPDAVHATKPTGLGGETIFFHTMFRAKVLGRGSLLSLITNQSQQAMQKGLLGVSEQFLYAV